MKGVITSRGLGFKLCLAPIFGTAGLQLGKHIFDGKESSRHEQSFSSLPGFNTVGTSKGGLFVVESSVDARNLVF